MYFVLVNVTYINNFEFSLNIDNRIDGKILLTDEFITQRLKSLISDQKDRYKFRLALHELKYVT